MPLGNYPNWEACKRDQLSKGKSEEEADKICGSLENMSEVSEPPITYDVQGEYMTIRNVDIMELEEDAKGINMNRDWANEVIATHETRKEKSGYLPTVFLGHNDDNTEKPAIGRLDNLRLIGNKIYADIIRIKNELKEKIINEYPNRSVEIINNAISGLALLGSNSPYFKLRPFFTEDINAITFFGENNKTIIINHNLRTMAENEKVIEGEELQTEEKAIEPEVTTEPVEEPEEEVHEEAEGVVVIPEAKAEEATEMKEVEKLKKDLEGMRLYKEMYDKANAQLREHSIKEKVMKFVASKDNEDGTILEKDAELLIEHLKDISDSKHERLLSFVAGLPKLGIMFAEIGSAQEKPDAGIAPAGVSESSYKLDKSIKEYMEAHKCDYVTAYTEVSKTFKL